MQVGDVRCGKAMQLVVRNAQKTAPYPQAKKGGGTNRQRDKGGGDNYGSAAL